MTQLCDILEDLNSLLYIISMCVVTSGSDRQTDRQTQLLSDASTVLGDIYTYLENLQLQFHAEAPVHKQAVQSDASTVLGDIYTYLENLQLQFHAEAPVHKQAVQSDASTVLGDIYTYLENLQLQFHAEAPVHK